jgi:hypothetical protein
MMAGRRPDDLMLRRRKRSTNISDKIFELTSLPEVSHVRNRSLNRPQLKVQIP